MNQHPGDPRQLPAMFVCLCASAVATAQNGGDVAWELQLAGDGMAFGRSVVEAYDGGFIVAGWTADPELREHHAYLVKIGADGEIRWERSFGDIGVEGLESVASIADGNYVVAGSTSFLTSDIYLSRRDAAGEVVWQRSLGGPEPDYGHSAQETRDGGYIVGGWTVTAEGTHSEIYLAKTYPEGEVQWEKRYGGIQLQGARASATDEAPDGTFLVAGVTKIDSPVLPTRYVLKVGVDGQPLWESTIGPETGNATWVQPISAESSLVAWTIATFSEQGSFVGVIGEGGTVQWQTRFVESVRGSDSYGVLASGGFLVAGGYPQDDHNRTCALQIAGADYYGQYLWGQSFVPTSDEECRAVAIQTLDGDYVMVGGTAGHLYVVKLVREPPNPLLFVRGDADGNGKQDITDPIVTVQRLFTNGPELQCHDAADANDDGKVDIADAIAFLNHLFRGGELPAIPSRFCGLDPTPDELDCQGQPACMPES